MRHLLRYIEFVFLFVGLPIVVYQNLIPIPKIAILLIVVLYCLLILWHDSSYVMRRLSYRPPIEGMWKTILSRSALVAGALILLTIILQPNDLFRFPRENTTSWFIVMLLYPVLSVLPQELIYREFFFHRYKQLLGSGWLIVATSAGAFSFLHIVYDNNYAIILSLIGGFVFARSYQKTRSLYWVSIEHTFYGCLLFTIGLGSYFYEAF